MATIVTRSGKGSPLTNTEVDANFTNLNNDKLETSAAYVHPNHSGEVTSSADGATVVASNVIDANNLKVTGNGSTSQFLRSDGDGTFTWATPADTDTVYTHPNHSGEVTSTADGATVIADDVVDEANLKVSNAPTNGYFLSAQSGNTGGLTWAEVSSGGGSPDLYAENPSSPTAPSATGTNAVAIGDGASATNNYSLAIGGTASASNSTAVAIGYGATASSGSSLALGRAASATTGGFNTALGYNAVSAGSGGTATALTKSYASGANSFAAAIANNTSSYGATGANSVAIGDRTKATGTGAVALSALSVASGFGSFAAVRQADALGQYAVAIGNLTDANQSNSFALGSWSKSDVLGKFAYASGGYVNTGESQFGLVVLRGATTDAASKNLTSSGGTPSATNQIILPNNSAYAFHGTIVARQQASAGTASAAWKIEGLIRREGSAGTTVLVNSATTVLDNTPSWGMALSADTTNGGLKIQVTGAASTNIRWVATINTSEVTY